MIANMDFETYSEAGYAYESASKRWVPISSSPPHGLGAVGAPRYAEHPSTEVLSLAYDLKDRHGPRLWLPGMAPPQDLFNYIARGGLINAWNSAFEYHIWTHVCTATLGWPPLPYEQLRDAMARARAWSLPGSLKAAAEALGSDVQKVDDGKRLLNKFSLPRKPTANNSSLRIKPGDDLADAVRLYDYNLRDIEAESAVSERTPQLSPNELKLWLLDQKINFRGVTVDIDSVANCQVIVEQATAKYTRELETLTDGAVTSATRVAKLAAWLADQGVKTESLNKAAVADLLDDPTMPAAARRALEIRALIGASSVKKLAAIDRRVSSDGRLRDLFAFCGADRTGRFSGRGPQPQNLPNSGPLPNWNIDAVDAALDVIATRDLARVELYYGNAISAVSGCLRGLFVAAPGHDLICSDYSAIEAVVLAQLAGEQWRINVFNTHGKIYEMSAAKITGIPFEEFERHKRETGEHHPMRKKIGKVAELASGYQGGYGAWAQFGAEDHLAPAEIEESIKKWRQESPAIVRFWYALQDAAIAAVQNPGVSYSVRGLTYLVTADVLYCYLLSGRALAYHAPRVHPKSNGRYELSYMGWNTDHKKGPRAWMRLSTYGGKLAENITQATARDILAHAIINLEAARYPIVLHVHDEVVAEVPTNYGSIREFESIMTTLPTWCANWPIRAAGGWRGYRYRKD